MPVQIICQEDDAISEVHSHPPLVVSRSHSPIMMLEFFDGLARVRRFDMSRGIYSCEVYNSRGCKELEGFDEVSIKRGMVQRLLTLKDFDELGLYTCQVYYSPPGSSFMYSTKPFVIEVRGDGYIPPPTGRSGLNVNNNQKR